MGLKAGQLCQGCLAGCVILGHTAWRPGLLLPSFGPAHMVWGGVGQSEEEAADSSSLQSLEPLGVLLGVIWEGGHGFPEAQEEQPAWVAGPADGKDHPCMVSWWPALGNPHILSSAHSRALFWPRRAPCPGELCPVVNPRMGAVGSHSRPAALCWGCCSCLGVISHGPLCLQGLPGNRDPALTAPQWAVHTRC